MADKCVRVKTMIIFTNGNIAAFDEHDNQIAELQRRSLIQVWADFAARQGYDVDGCECVSGSHGEPGHRLVLEPSGDGEWRMEPIV